jgi:cytochrome b6-f complex iron-sulfur subunit
MDRKQFLSTLGLGAAFALTASCLGSCKKTATTPSGPVDFTLDLTAAANTALNTNGGYVISNGCVVAKTTTGTYAAATQICSHEGRTQVIYDATNNNWYCTAHGARFNITGGGLNSNGSSGLTIYKTQLTGNMLRVYS